MGWEYLGCHNCGNGESTDNILVCTDYYPFKIIQELFCTNEKLMDLMLSEYNIANHEAYRIMREKMECDHQLCYECLRFYDLEDKIIEHKIGEITKDDDISTEQLDTIFAVLQLKLKCKECKKEKLQEEDIKIVNYLLEKGKKMTKENILLKLKDLSFI
jgi:hypothetical protein